MTLPRMRIVADFGKSKIRKVLISSKRRTSAIWTSTVARCAIFRIAATTGAASARRVSRTLVARRTNRSAAIAAKARARSPGENAREASQPTSARDEDVSGHEAEPCPPE